MAVAIILGLYIRINIFNRSAEYHRCSLPRNPSNGPTCYLNSASSPACWKMLSSSLNIASDHGSNGPNRFLCCLGRQITQSIRGHNHFLRPILTVNLPSTQTRTQNNKVG
eukprot:scaffold8930_cov189-Skeletonema_menzelii.AAC.1